MNYKKLLIKYIVHIISAEGFYPYAENTRFARCDMGELKFTDEEERELVNDIFPEAIKIYRQS